VDRLTSRASSRVLSIRWWESATRTDCRRTVRQFNSSRAFSSQKQQQCGRRQCDNRTSTSSRDLRSLSALVLSIVALINEYDDDDDDDKPRTGLTNSDGALSIRYPPHTARTVSRRVSHPAHQLRWSAQVLRATLDHRLLAGEWPQTAVMNIGVLVPWCIHRVTSTTTTAAATATITTDDLVLVVYSVLIVPEVTSISNRLLFLLHPSLSERKNYLWVGLMLTWLASNRSCVYGDVCIPETEELQRCPSYWYRFEENPSSKCRDIGCQNKTRKYGNYRYIATWCLAPRAQ